jgi:hypothetical protein
MYFAGSVKAFKFLLKISPVKISEKNSCPLRDGNHLAQTFVENWIVIHLCRILKYFYFNISYKGKIDSLTPPLVFRKLIRYFPKVMQKKLQKIFIGCLLESIFTFIRHLHLPKDVAVSVFEKHSNKNNF